MLGVPLLREGAPIGVIALTRSASCVRSTDKQIELVATFDQAVIAIENVRLFDEVQALTKELTSFLSSRLRRRRCCRSSAAHPASYRARLQRHARKRAPSVRRSSVTCFCAKATGPRGRGDRRTVLRRHLAAEPDDSCPKIPASQLTELFERKERCCTWDPSYLAGNARILALVDTAGTEVNVRAPAVSTSARMRAFPAR